MPSFAWRLNDAQVADLLTYVRNSWGNAAAPVGADEVATVRTRLRAGF
jgi:mono/diheme cytochrome c family protein